MTETDAAARRWIGRRLLLAVTLPLTVVILGVAFWVAPEPRPRVLLIGIDGADWGVIDRLRTSGRSLPSRVDCNKVSVVKDQLRPFESKRQQDNTAHLGQKVSAGYCKHKKPPYLSKWDLE